MSSPIGYPQGNAYPMFSSASVGDKPVAVGKEKEPLYVTTTSDGGLEIDDGNVSRSFVTSGTANGVPTGNFI